MNFGSLRPRRSELPGFVVMALAAVLVVVSVAARDLLVGVVGAMVLGSYTAQFTRAAPPRQPPAPILIVAVGILAAIAVYVAPLPDIDFRTGLPFWPGAALLLPGTALASFTMASLRGRLRLRVTHGEL